MKKLLINYWAIISIFIVWFVFSSPYFLENKSPFAATYQVNNFAPWSANSQFWGPVKNSAMPDVITQIYPWRHLAIEIWKSGQIPLWNPYSFSGTPLLANYQSSVLSPFNILFFILPFTDGWSILILLQPLLAGLFMYLFVRSLKIGKAGSLIAAFSFMFCGFITTWMGYGTLGYAILFLPLALYAVEKYFEISKNKFLILLSLTIPLSFFSGHFQISLYFLFSLLAYIAYKFVLTKNIHHTLQIMLYAFLGLLLAMPQFLPSIELYLQSFRSSFFQTGGIAIKYLPAFLVPDFFGNPVTRNNWFGHYAEWNGYIGIIPFILAICSILSKKRLQTFFWFTLGIMALLISLDSPILKFLILLKLPVFSTSPANRAIVIYSFAFSVLSAFGFEAYMEHLKNKKTKIIFILLGLFGSIFLFLWILVLLKVFIPLDKVSIVRQNLILPTFVFLFFILTAFTTILYFKYKKSSKLLILVSFALIFIVGFDMLRFAKKWQAFDPKSLVFPDTQTTKAFSKISGHERVLGNLGGEAFIYYHLPSVEGYDALYNKRYGEFINYIEKNELIKSAWSVVSFPKYSKNTEKALNLLNIKYIVHKIADDRVSWTFPFWTYPSEQFELIYKDSMYEFYENKNSFPRAFLVGNYKVMRDQKQILETIFNNSFDTRREIVLEENPRINKTQKDIGEAKVVNYQPNIIEISVEAKSKALLFLADAYYQGWKVKIDGQDSPIYRANYSFRAVAIPKGAHNVKFIYDPLSFRLGIYLAGIGFFAILVLQIISAKNRG